MLTPKAETDPLYLGYAQSEPFLGSDFDQNILGPKCVLVFRHALATLNAATARATVASTGTTRAYGGEDLACQGAWHRKLSSSEHQKQTNAFTHV